VTGQLAIDGVPDPDRSRGAWWTPPKLARRIAEWADLEGCGVIEPAAGIGNLARPATAYAEHVTAVEVDPATYRSLAKRCGGLLTHHCGDAFRLVGDHWDVCLMNPPDVGECLLQWLELGAAIADRTVALIRLNGLTTFDRAGFWKRVHMTRITMLARRPKFSAAGGSQEWCVVEWERERPPLSGGTDIEWWTEAWS